MVTVNLLALLHICYESYWSESMLLLYWEYLYLKMQIPCVSKASFDNVTWEDYIGLQKFITWTVEDMVRWWLWKARNFLELIFTAIEICLQKMAKWTIRVLSEGFHHRPFVWKCQWDQGSLHLFIQKKSNQIAGVP